MNKLLPIENFNEAMTTIEAFEEIDPSNSTVITAASIETILTHLTRIPHCLGKTSSKTTLYF
jgi:hypothetical protein